MSKLVRRARALALEDARVLRAATKALPHARRADPVASATLTTVLVLQGLTAPALAYLVGQSIGMATGATGSEVARLASLWILLFALQAALDPISFLLTARMNESLTRYIQEQIMDLGALIENIAVFDDSPLYDEMSILSREAGSRPANLVILYNYVLRGVVTTLSLAALLAVVAWWLPVAMIVAGVPMSRAVLRIRRDAFMALLSKTSESRYMDYLTQLSISRPAAREIRLFRLHHLLRRKYDAAATEYFATLRGSRREATRRSLPAILVGLATSAGAMVAILLGISRGEFDTVTIGTVIPAFVQLRGAVADISENFGYLSEKAFFYERFDAFARAVRDDTGGLYQLASERIVDTPASAWSIEFRNVSFSYPNSASKAVCDVNFSVRAGESIAIVGENGAGKSTLTRLLCRFYDPSDGEILVNGTRLSLLDPASWRSQIAAVFQDFQIYCFTVAENVSLGLADERAVSDALEFAFADSGTDRRPNGDDVLGADFGGRDLSGGEGQRIAIARSMARSGASVVVLDEPTAGLDPVREARVLDSFRTIVAGRTSFVVTHRLGFALSADRVLVMKGGLLVEDGSPDELIAADGEFARMVQAQSGPGRAPHVSVGEGKSRTDTGEASP